MCCMYYTQEWQTAQMNSKYFSQSVITWLPATVLGCDLWWPYFVDEVFGNNFTQAGVQLLSMFMKHHCVGVPIKFLKTQAAVVLPLNFLDGILQKVPYVVDVLLVHRHLQEVTSNGFQQDYNQWLVVSTWRICAWEHVHTTSCSRRSVHFASKGAKTPFTQA